MGAAAHVARRAPGVTMETLRILQLCTYDRGGGAEKVALDLHRAYLAAGHDARLVVRHRWTDTPGVVELDAFAGVAPWGGASAALDGAVRGLGRFRGQYRVSDALRQAAWPRRWLDRRRGVEDFNYPASYTLLDGWRPDLVHAHNLHGDFFDLRALVPMSLDAPVVWTLHDTWALTGHCAYFIDCRRWETGCGACPDLRRAPAVRRDATAENWERKRRIYAMSRLAVVTPSRWLMDQVERSTLRPWRAEVIANGVDRSVFRPGDRAAARAELGLPQDALVCLYVAMSASAANPYKDVATVADAIALAAGQSEGRVVFVGLGGDARPGDDPRFVYPGYVADARLMARYYQAADVLLHAAHAEVFGLAIAEALACATPVIATAVGGIPELVADGVNGWLVARGDSAAMARRLLELRERGAPPGVGLAPERVDDLRAQAQRYIGLYDEVIAEYEGSVA